jgi:hypothetical protein
MYKDGSSAKFDVIEPKPTKSKFESLDELSKSTIQNKDHKDEALTNSQKQKQFMEVELDEHRSLTDKCDDEES